MTRLVVGGAIVGLLVAHAGGHAAGVLLLGGLVVGAWAFAARGRAAARSTARTVHFDAGEWKVAAAHEAGHLAAFKAAGGRNLRGRIYRDGSGWASADLPPDVSVQDDVAIDYAGGYGAGEWTGCGSDLAGARKRLGGVGWFQRGSIEADARRLARKSVGGGRTDRYRQRLERTGRWR